MEEVKAPDISSQYLSKERMELLTYLSGDVSRVRYHATERTVALERALTDLPGDVKARDKRLADIDRDLHVARDDLDILSTWENASERVRNEARARVAQLDEALLISAQMIVLGALTVPAPSVEGDRTPLTVRNTTRDYSGKHMIVAVTVIESGFIASLKKSATTRGMVLATALVVPSLLFAMLVLGAIGEDPEKHQTAFFDLSFAILIVMVCVFARFGYLDRNTMSDDDSVSYRLNEKELTHLFDLHNRGGNKRAVAGGEVDVFAGETFTAMCRIADGKDNEAKRRLADWIVNYKRLVMPINPQSEYTELTDKERKIVTSLYGEMLTLTRDPEAEKEEMRQKLAEQREELERIAAQEEVKRERESAMDGYLATHPAQTE